MRGLHARPKYAMLCRVPKPPDPPTFWAFNWRLVRDIPHAFRHSFEAWAFWVVSVAIPTALIIRPNLGPKLDLSHLPRWVGLVPIALSVLYGMMRANHKKFHALQVQFNAYIEYEMARRQKNAVKAALGNQVRDFWDLQRRAEKLENVGQLMAEYRDKSALLATFVEQHVDRGEAAIVTFSQPHPGPYDESSEARLANAPDHLTLFRYCAAKVEALANLIPRIDKNEGPDLTQ